ncbi:MAG: hypothetical protein ACOCVS_03670 [Planctomycetota bacterium]
MRLACLLVLLCALVTVVLDIIAYAGSGEARAFAPSGVQLLPVGASLLAISNKPFVLLGSLLRARGERFERAVRLYRQTLLSLSMLAAAMLLAASACSITIASDATL